MSGQRKGLRGICGESTAAIASKLAPTGICAVTKIQCGSELARDAGTAVFQEACATDSGRDQIHTLPRLIPAIAR